MSETLDNKPEETLRAYVKAFEALDPGAVVPFYHLPSVFLAPPGVTLVPDTDAAHGLASRLIENARSQNYRRTEILDLEVRRLADNLASLSGIFVRFNPRDEEINRFGFAYTMHSDGTAWRIVVAIAHGAPPART